MKKSTFTQSIYAGTSNVEETPYQTWLRLTTEKVLLQSWLQAYLPTFDLSKKTNRLVRVLDLGCGFGHMAMRLIRVLHSMGLHIDYTGIDPYQTQLDQFERSTPLTPNLTLRLLKGDASSHVPDQDYDLVFASHMLYYVENWHDALKRIVDAGHEAILVHHGLRGINTIQERFRKHVHPGSHVISTDDQVAEILDFLPFKEKRVTHHRFPSTVNVRDCQNPTSQSGNNLVSFFLERPFKDIHPRIVHQVREVMLDLYAPDHLMVHDVGIFTIR